MIVMFSIECNCFFIVDNINVIFFDLGFNRYWYGDCCVLCFFCVKCVFFRKFIIEIGIFLNFLYVFCVVFIFLFFILGCFVKYFLVYFFINGKFNVYYVNFNRGI